MPAKRYLFALTFALLSLSSGCGEYPFADWGLVDPWSRKAWREDERYGPTYHTKRKELLALREKVPSLSADEKERTAIELAERLRVEKHAVLRSDMIRALGELPSPVASDALRAAVHDSDADVRVVACEVWGRRGGEEGRQILAAALGSDTDLDVRMAATRELGRFKDDPQAMQAIKLALDENNPALQHRAVESLRSMTGKDYGSDMLAWKEFVDGGNPPEPPAATLADRLKSWY